MKNLCKIFFVILLLCAFVGFVYASSGTIDATYKYAQFLNSAGGDLNFGAPGGGVTVTDTELTGYVWGNMVGWISLNCGNVSCTTQNGNFKVLNDGQGNLSGNAWGQNTGWISFKSTSGNANHKVVINGSGQFLGYAWSQNLGWIKFDCGAAATCVTTDWRVVTTPTPPPTHSGGGGSVLSGNPTGTPPQETIPTNLPTENPVNPLSPPPGPTPTPGPNPAPTPTPNPVPVSPLTPTSSNNPSQNPSQAAGPGAGVGSGSGGDCLSLKSFLPCAFDQTKASYDYAKNSLNVAAGEIKKVVNEPAVSTTAKVVAVAGIAFNLAMASSLLFANPITFSELFFLPFRLWSLLLSALGLKKRYKPWGTVYDSVTKQPLDPAYVVLQDVQGNNITTSITDLDGRYGFFMGGGRYKIVANKTNYTFPSARLAGKAEDELYSDLYFGESIMVGAGEVISKNIPMDPIGFDWNEFMKNKNKMLKYYSARDQFLKKCNDILFKIGFVVALIALWAAPHPYNIAIFALYVVLVVLRRFGLKPRQFGHVTEKETGSPLSFAVVSIISVVLGKQIAQKVADKFGRYYCLVPEGRYQVKIQKKNADESYEDVYLSPVLTEKNGIIDERFEV